MSKQIPDTMRVPLFATKARHGECWILMEAIKERDDYEINKRLISVATLIFFCIVFSLCYFNKYPVVNDKSTFLVSLLYTQRHTKTHTWMHAPYIVLSEIATYTNIKYPPSTKDIMRITFYINEALPLYTCLFVSSS